MRRERPRELRVDTASDRDTTVALYRSRGYALLYERDGAVVLGRRNEIDMRWVFATWIYGFLPVVAYVVLNAFRPDRDLVEVRVGKVRSPVRSVPTPQ